MELISNWQSQDLTCVFCGSKKSVKYKIPVIVIDTLSTEKQTEKVCACNKCALLFELGSIAQ